jgi:type II secretory pathway pseudopilin PulG
MIALLGFVLAVLAAPFKSKSRLEAENAALRHQLIVLRRKLQGRVRLTNNDRWFLIQLYRWFPSILQVLTIVQPETLVRWHRAGFRYYWRWKSRPRGGRPHAEATGRVGEDLSRQVKLCDGIALIHHRERIVQAQDRHAGGRDPIQEQQ